MRKPRNQTIDILRLIAAFSIICLHNFSGSGVWGGEEIVAISRFAVPLFFMFSGYFAAAFDQKRKLRQLLRMVIWTVLGNLGYLAIELLRQPNDYVRRMRLMQLFPSGWLKNFLLFNESPISAHLWFLGAFVYILVLDLLLGWLFDKLPRAVKWGSTGMLMLGGLTLYHLLTRAPEVDYPLYAYRNFLLLGLPFFLAGKLIRSGSFSKKKLPAPLYPVLLILSSGLSLAEYYLVGVWELYLGSILTAFLLMHLALCHPLADAPKPVRVLGWLGRETSFAVYIIHIYFLDWLRGIYWEHLPWQYEPGVFHLIPLGVFAVSVAMGSAMALARIGIKRLIARKG